MHKIYCTYYSILKDWNNNLKTWRVSLSNSFTFRYKSKILAFIENYEIRVNTSSKKKNEHYADV